MLHGRGAAEGLGRGLHRCLACDELTTSHITSSVMWIGCNHEDHAVQNLNMQITQLQLQLTT